jgi:putative endonuclease
VRTFLTPSKTSSKPKPRHPSELRAARWYRLHAYRVLATNVWLAGAELDIVARRGRTVVFCEVKSKAGDRFGDPLEMITPVKVERIERAADAWLRLHPELRGLAVRFDVIAVRGGKLEHIPQAF